MNRGNDCDYVDEKAWTAKINRKVRVTGVDKGKASSLSI